MWGPRPGYREPGDEAMKEKLGETLVVASGKGGTGKTVFAANMGAALALREHSVVLVDMNIGLRNLDLCLGLENSIVYDLTDAVIGICRLKQALVRDKRFPELYLMSAAQNRDKARITLGEMRDLCLMLKKKFDYVIIDAPSGMGEDVRLAAAGADRAVLVTNPEYGAVRDADALDQLLARWGIRKKCVVINKVRPELLGTGVLPEPSDIAESLRIPVAGIIQNDENVLISANIGVPLVMEEGTYFEKNFLQIIERILS